MPRPAPRDRACHERGPVRAGPPPRRPAAVRRGLPPRRGARGTGRGSSCPPSSQTRCGRPLDAFGWQ
ncbi:hypothetical protein C5C39_02015 [Rathayibacter sp. AY1F3]|nr:hypothetical protein C5C39_02015 [Rathayibacter sp. AY1F3]